MVVARRRLFGYSEHQTGPISGSRPRRRGHAISQILCFMLAMGGRMSEDGRQSRHG
jgi:hypothetical protein